MYKLSGYNVLISLGHTPHLLGSGLGGTHGDCLFFQEMAGLVLAGWLSWLKCCCVHPKVAGWVPGWRVY